MTAVVAFVLLVVVASASATKIECEAEPDIGFCNNMFHRYFFNTTTGRCQTFVYGGCGNSPNNFVGYKECHDYCAPGTPYSGVQEGGLEINYPLRAVDKEVLCAQKAETGMCKAYFPSFFYNSETGKCESFVYGGCGGNDNRFGSEEACHATCAPAKKEVDTAVLCAQRAETGMCRAYIPSFFFNYESGKCEKFIYGGCGGNDNRFDSADECHATCGHVKKVDKQVLCTQKAQTGLCMAYIPSFFYNAETQKCESFVYGGCAGNDNRFKTEEDCHATCAGVTVQKKRSVDTELLCAQKSEVGPCRAHMPRYFFNTESAQCEQFFYGGCAGNENNFKTKEACHQTCGQPKAAPETPEFNIRYCFLEADAGNCFGAFTRFHFNRKTATCEPFLFGGCAGNQNNFKSQHDCENHCLV